MTLSYSNTFHIEFEIIMKLERDSNPRPLALWPAPLTTRPWAHVCVYVERTFLVAAGERFCSCRCARVVEAKFQTRSSPTTQARTQVRLHAISLKSAHACRSSAESENLY